MDEIHEEIEKGEKWAARLWSREAILLTALASLAVMFTITVVVVNFYTAKQSELAKIWYQRGNQALEAKHPEQAIEDLRNAINYDPNNETYKLRAAQALAAANRIDQAEGYLLEIQEQKQGSGEINLELAQLEARKGKPDAVSYYTRAIYGVWENDPLQHRWDARLQLFRYWVSQGNTGQAQAQLLAMAADTPEEDFKRHTQVGQLQLGVNDPRHALDQFRMALRVNRRYVPALAGAGEAEFALGEYQNAVPYLQSAVRLSPKNEKAASRLHLARLILSSDPFQIGISEKERMQRTMNAFHQAQSTLASCASKHNVNVNVPTPRNAFQETWARGQQLLPLVSKLRRKSENDLRIMNFVYMAENLAATECGPLEGKDQALWLIGKKHRLAEASGQGAK